MGIISVFIITQVPKVLFATASLKKGVFVDFVDFVGFMKYPQ